MSYTPHTFSLPTLAGMSDESVREHLALYEGYVKNFNAITDEIEHLKKNIHPSTPLGAGAHAVSELMRRRSFEFGGMRLHEYYFTQFEQGPHTLNTESPLAQIINTQYQNSDALIAELRATALMRGPGWALVYYDPAGNQLLTGFSGEQHQGHFVTLPIILALDVWEHAYLKDYGALGKAKYIDAFFENLNWSVVEARFVRALSV